MLRLFLLTLCCGAILLSGGCATPEAGDSHKLSASQLPGITVIDAAKQVFRGEQPNRAEFRQLARAGFKSVLNLREYHSDQGKISGLEIREYRLPLAAGSVTEADLVAALRILLDAPKPILIHCWHGADRTGVVSAAYRIAVQNWPVEDAVAEMEKPEFGYHKIVYPNLVELLRNANWTNIRAELKQ